MVNGTMGSAIGLVVLADLSTKTECDYLIDMYSDQPVMVPGAMVSAIGLVVLVDLFTKTECDYLNGWIKNRSHTQKSHPQRWTPEI